MSILDLANFPRKTKLRRNAIITELATTNSTPKLLLDKKAVAQRLSISEQQACSILKAKVMTTVRIGRSDLVTPEELEIYVAKLVRSSNCSKLNGNEEKRRSVANNSAKASAKRPKNNGLVFLR